MSAVNESERVCTLIFGEPGIGKTRLLAEARHRSRASTYDVACIQTTVTIPFDPLIALVRALHRDRRLTTRQFEALLASDEKDWLLNFCDALGRAAATSPFCIQLDDIQFADEQTLEAIRYCVTRLCDLQISWQLASRRSSHRVIEIASALERAELARVIHLGGLTKNDLKALAEQLRPELILDEPQISELYRLTGGNPLYAELSLVAPILDGSSATSDLRQILLQRLSALNPEASDLASWLAVNVEPISATQLAFLMGRSEGHVGRVLADLVNEAIVEETADGFRFRHELLREACYASLMEPNRTAIHSVLADRSVDDWHRAAHLDGACRFDEAAALFNQIGWDRLDRHSPQEALNAFDCAAARCDAVSQAAIEANGGKAAALVALGRFAEAREAIQAVEGHTLTLSPEVRVRIRSLYARSVWEETDDGAYVLPFAESALSEAERFGPMFVSNLLYIIGSVEERRNELGRARVTLEKGVGLCREPRQRRDQIQLSSWLGVVLARMGDTPGGLAELESAARNARLWNLGDELAQCCIRLCYVARLAGDSEAFERWCRVGLDAEGPKSRATESVLRSYLASVAIDRGRLREALGLAVTADTSVLSNKPVHRCRLLCLQIQLYAMLGDFGVGQRVLDDALQFDWAKRERRSITFSAGFAAELRDDLPHALQHYRETVADLAISDFNEVLEVRALGGVARLTGLRGDIKTAQRAIEQLRAVAKRGSPIAERTLCEAEGCVSLARGDSRGADQLLEAAEDEYPFWRAHLQLIAANIKANRELFLKAIDTFDEIGAEFAADRARALARAHGLRPGRKREAHGALSSREASVAFLIASGKTNAEIGELLHISGRTVEYHVGNILGKCGLRSRVEIAATLAAGKPLGAPAETSANEGGAKPEPESKLG